MSESMQTAPLLDGMLTGDPISQHHGVRCCPAIRENTDERYIVKILSIPASQVQVDALLLTGAYSTPAQALNYFHELAQETLKETEILERLSKLGGFVSFVGGEVRKMKEGQGYQVYLLSPYRRSLARQLQKAPLTHLEAVNLGLDLCEALAICRRSGSLYIDLKPSNIFNVPNQGWRIGDLGFIPMANLKYASFPDKYRSSYTAPEIIDELSDLNDTIDVYALGLVLYQVYNNGELPFEGSAPNTPLAPPMYADYELAEIILKACNPDPANRWTDPIQMGQALVAYMQRNSVNDVPIGPVPVPESPEAEPVPEEQPAPEQPSAEPDVQEQEEELIIPGASAEAELGALLNSLLSEDTPTESEPDVLPEDRLDPAQTEVLPEQSDSEDTAADQDPELSCMVEEPANETVPTEETVSELPSTPVSSEVEDILAQADELIAHKLPEPPVAPEPIDVPFPPPIVLTEENVGDAAEQEAEETTDAEPAETEQPTREPDIADELRKVFSEEDASEEAQKREDAPEEADTQQDDEPLFEATEDDALADLLELEKDDEEYDEDDEEAFDSDHARRSKISRLLITVTCCLLLLVGLCFGGILFYQFYYLQPVNFMVLEGSVDSLTAEIRSNIEDDLLTAVCTDTYGNTRLAAVINGRAHFPNLTPNTQYRVQLEISGFHQLTGVTSGTYTTDAQTEILNFNAVAGPEEGSVILSFTVNGPETDTWTLGYSSANAPEQTLPFNGHTVTVSDLEIGSEYLFRLIPSNDQFLAGNWQVNYKVQPLVYAQELNIRSCGNGVLVAVWNVPESMEGQSWNVRCYNDNGYDKTITTTEAEAQFTELDHTYGYTVEVTAVGMTQSSSAKVTANPITLTDISASHASSQLRLSWTYTGEAPAEGWILDYTIDGGSPVTLSCKEASAELPGYYGSKYTVDIRPVGDVTFYEKPFSHEIKPASKFSDFGVTYDDMSFYMCNTPSKKNWDRFDVPAEDYTKEFKVGKKASFLVELWQDYDKSDDKVAITFIIRNEADQPVSRDTVNSSWNKMWSKRFCELDIPKLPDTAGKYSVEIYFNNQYVYTETFTMK